MNLSDFDNFDDEEKHFVVHITIKQRTKSKFITYVADFPKRYDLNKILRYIKKIYKCGGSILKQRDEIKDTVKEVIQLSGDQRDNIRDFFINYNVLDKENIIVHGF